MITFGRGLRHLNIKCRGIYTFGREVKAFKHY